MAYEEEPGIQIPDKPLPHGGVTACPPSPQAKTASQALPKMAGTDLRAVRRLKPPNHASASRASPASSPLPPLRSPSTLLPSALPARPPSPQAKTASQAPQNGWDRPPGGPAVKTSQSRLCLPRVPSIVSPPYPPQSLHAPPQCPDRAPSIAAGEGRIPRAGRRLRPRLGRRPSPSSPFPNNQ